jgi:hypothetical protein
VQSHLDGRLGAVGIQQGQVSQQAQQGHAEDHDSDQ